MGLIKAALGAAGGVMADQWKEFFYCEAIPANAGGKEGRRPQAAPATPRGMTTSSPMALSSPWPTASVCSSWSRGKVVDMCAEPGEYTYDISHRAQPLHRRSGGIHQGRVPEHRQAFHLRRRGPQGPARSTISIPRSSPATSQEPQPRPLPGGGPAGGYRHRYRHPLLRRVQHPPEKPHAVLYQCLRQHQRGL